MPTSRQKILAYIRKQQTASAMEISRAMKMTSANARYHLEHLEANGLIEVAGQRRKEGRGRPLRVYGLSRTTLGDNLDNLADALLAEFLVNLPSKKREEHLYALSKRLAVSANELSGSSLASPGQATAGHQAGMAISAREMSGSSTSGQRDLGQRDLGQQNIPITRRLAATVDRLNELHYQARWEAGAAGPRLTLGYCPYAAVIKAHPELCQMDAFLLEERLGLSVKQTAKLQPSAKGLPFCEFLVELSAGNR
jgi:predicted ArsR family transcriptional regulator